jgi:hypothetical protein
MVPWLVRITLSTVLYEIDVCMKVFNMASPSSASEVRLIGRCVSLLLNYIKKMSTEHFARDAPNASTHCARLFLIFEAF